MNTTAEIENQDTPAEVESIAIHSAGAKALRFILPLVFLAMGGLGYAYLSTPEEEEKAPPPKEQVIRTRVTELAVHDYTIIIDSNGVVQPHNEITLSAQVSGLIQTLSPAIEAGSYFKEGDVLVALDDRDYVTALHVAEAQLASAKSAYELTRLNHERMLEGYNQQDVIIVTKAEVDLAYSEREQAKAQVRSAEAQVEQAELDLDRTKVRAPFDGRVRMKSVGLGQSVNTGTELAVVFAVDYAEVRLPIASTNLQYLNLPELDGDPTVPVTLTDAINLESETTWEGTIVRTEGTLDENSLETYAIARVYDPFGLETGKPPLRIGQPVVGLIEGESLLDVVTVPRIAVRELDQIVLIDGDALTLTKLTVDPIWSDEDFIVVRDPMLRDGTLVATTQIVYAPEGAKVEIIPEIPVETGS